MGYIEVFQYYQTNNNLLNIVIWKSFLIRFRHKTLKIYAPPKVVMRVPRRRVVHNLVAGKLHQAGIRFVTLGEN